MINTFTNTLNRHIRKKPSNDEYSINIYGTLSCNKKIDEKTISYINDLKNNSNDEYKCHWIVNEDNEIVWDGSHSFKNYLVWLDFIIRLLVIDGHTLNGMFMVRRDDINYRTIIKIENNEIREMR